MLIWLAAAALGAECRWTKIESVTSSMTEVTINGESIPVVGRESWEPLVRDLQVCGLTEAAFALQRWRSNRRATNTTAALGVPTFMWTWVATPFTAMAANQWRIKMETALLRGDE